MRAPMLAVALLLAAGCGQASPPTTPLGAAEHEYVVALRDLEQPIHLPADDTVLVGLGRSACTQLAYDVGHRQSAAAIYIKAVAGDYPTAYAITWSAALHLCPKTAAEPVSPTPTGPEPAQGVFTPAPAAVEPPAGVEEQAPSNQLNEVGKTVSNGGITLTVKAARTTNSILLNESGSRPGSGFERYTKTSAGSGAKFVVVETHVVNNAKSNLDLTCSLPVTAKLVDDQQRNFDPIDDLYKLEGNPECNDNLQPGFESDMTWIYRVPTAAKVLGWGFQDTTDLSMLGNDFTVVRLQV